jgi:hypothetical protein
MVGKGNSSYHSGHPSDTGNPRRFQSKPSEASCERQSRRTQPSRPCPIHGTRQQETFHHSGAALVDRRAGFPCRGAELCGPPDALRHSRRPSRRIWVSMTATTRTSSTSSSSPTPSPTCFRQTGGPSWARATAPRLFVVWWSLANVVTAWAQGMRRWARCRFSLGLGEAGIWPAASKIVSEWFPARERALAIGFYTMGATIGATIAPYIVIPLCRV